MTLRLIWRQMVVERDHQVTHDTALRETRFINEDIIVHEGESNNTTFRLLSEQSEFGSLVNQFY